MAKSATAQAALRVKPRKKRLISPPSPSRIVQAANVQVLFDSHTGKKSQYLEQLEKLIAAGPDNFLEFDCPTARGAIAQQAKKHHIRVLFGVGTGPNTGKLYVKIMGKDSPEQAVLEFLEAHGPAELPAVVSALAKSGYEGINAKEILQRLSENGKIALRSEPRTGTLKWQLVPASAGK